MGIETMQEKRYEQNLAVLAQFKRGQGTAETLKEYSGWGGLREAIYTPTIYGKLRRILSVEEIASIKKTLKNAYYTPKELVCFMYGFLETLGFQGGNILEPSIGNGVFIEHMPEVIRRSSRIVGVEIDKVTAGICKKLYPDVRLYTGGFETFQPNQRYELIIGNPPYGSDVLVDAQHPDLSDKAIHHYFVAKSMRLLNDNGILAMVLPSYFLDNESKHVRDIIAREGGEMIAAYRLPDNLFKDATVTVDIVFLKKVNTETNRTNINWVKTPGIKVAGYTRPLNEYYHAHPAHILGDLGIVTVYGKKRLTCRRSASADREPLLLLNQVLEKLKTPATVQTDLIKIKKTALDQLCAKVDNLSQMLQAALQELQDLKMAF